jgi:hypothetical protein
MSGAGYAARSTISMRGCTSSKRLNTSRDADHATLLLAMIDAKGEILKREGPGPQSFDRALRVGPPSPGEFTTFSKVAPAVGL